MKGSWAAFAALFLAGFLFSTGLAGAVATAAGAPPADVIASNSPSAEEGPDLTVDTTVTKYGRELPGLRSRSGRTYQAPNGSLKTVLHAEAVNYRDAQGKWQPIDNSLVPANGGYRNKANSFAVELPGALGGRPVRIEHDGVSVSFAPRALRGVAAVTGATGSFRDAARATTLEYTVTGSGLKEALVLASKSAPRSFTFDLSVQGATPKQSASGGVDFVSGGRVVSSFLPAFMVDARGARSNAVATSLAAVPSGHTVTVTPDRAWLQSPARRYPVVIDPTFEFTGGARECYIADGADENTNFCGNPTLNTGWDGTKRSRGLLEFSQINSDIPEKAVILDAELSLYLESKTTANLTSVAVHRVTRAFDDVTWNRASSDIDGNPTLWTTPGGDFNASAAATVSNVGGSAGVYHRWYLRGLVQDWVDRTQPNYGMLLKTPESVSNVFRYSSSWSTTATADQMPRLVITWNRATGLWGRYTFLDEPLSDRLALRTNVANGNLIIQESDLQIGGTGLDLSVERYFNSLSAGYEANGGGELGYSWMLGTGEDVYLEFMPDGSVGYHGPSGYTVPFGKDANGDNLYISPTAIDSTLTKNADGTWTITSHGSGVKQHFSAAGALTSIVDENANRISFSYGTCGLSSITDTQGRVTSFACNSLGLVTKITDPSGRAYQYAYDANGNLVTYTNPAGGITRYGYDSAGMVVVKITDPRGNVTTLAYDYNQRVTSITRLPTPSSSTGPTTSFTYNSGNTVVTDERGNKTTYYYDTTSRVTRVLDALGRERSATYTPNSNIETFTSGSSGVTTNGYDVNNNLTSTRLATGASSRWEFPTSGQLYLPTKAIDTQGNATGFAYDAKGNTTQVTNALAHAASFTYNANGTVASATDFKGNVTGYGYDAKGQLTAVDNPAPLGDTTYTYDSLSRLASEVDGKGQTTTFAYDTLDRLTKITYADGSAINYAYDANGNRTSLVDNTGTTSYAYDHLNRLTKETLPDAKTNTYTYDSAGNMLSFADAGGTLSYAYNTVNLLVTLTEPGGAQTSFVYDADDLRTETRYPNGVTMYVTYDAANRIVRVLGKKPASGTVLTDFTYSWTNASGQDTGLRQSVTDKDGTKTSYSYDALNRLTLAEERSSAGTLLNSYAYAYDANSNRSSQTVNGVTTTYSHNAADQLTAAGSVTYSYDGNGNETGSSAGRSFTYNPKDQVTSATPAGGSAISMSYSGTGQFDRVSAGTTTYTDSGLGLTRENSTSYTRDVGGLLLSQRTSSGTSYYLLDGVGSVAAVTDGAGNLAATYRYAPFGAPVASTGSLANPWRWLGGLGVYFDAVTGLYKMGTRYYDSSLGRFTQVDPVDGGSYNRYDYAAQDPINLVDVDGQVLVALIPVAIAAARLAVILVRLGPRFASAARALFAMSRAVWAGSKTRFVAAARSAGRLLTRVESELRGAYYRLATRIMACVTKGSQYMGEVQDWFFGSDVLQPIAFGVGCVKGFRRGP